MPLNLKLNQNDFIEKSQVKIKNLDLLHFSRMLQWEEP